MATHSFNLIACVLLLIVCLFSSERLPLLPSDMCQGHTDLCSNAGLCIGADRCSCREGSIGEFCNKTGNHDNRDLLNLDWLLDM